MGPTAPPTSPDDLLIAAWGSREPWWVPAEPADSSAARMLRRPDAAAADVATVPAGASRPDEAALDAAEPAA